MQRLLGPQEITRQLADLAGWHVLDGVLSARYEAPDFRSAAALVAEVARAAEEMDHHPGMHLRWTSVRFELSTHSVGGLTGLDVRLAHRVASAAAGLGAVSTDDVPAAVQLGIDATDPGAIRDFWRVGLRLRSSQDPADTELADPQGRLPGVWFQRMEPARRERSRTHVDLYLPQSHARHRVEEVLAAGGRLLSEEHAPSWWVLADAEGNELCVCTDADDPAEPTVA